jgi:hypothetical protein
MIQTHALTKSFEGLICVFREKDIVKIKFITYISYYKFSPRA